MKKKYKNNSSILESIHKTISELYKEGNVAPITMRKFDKLCLADVHDLSPADIKKIREKEHVSQSVFAAYLNISVSTIQKWEIGEKKPSGIALRFLNLIQKNGLSIIS